MEADFSPRRGGGVPDWILLLGHQEATCPRRPLRLPCVSIQLGLHESSTKGLNSGTEKIHETSPGSSASCQVSSHPSNTKRLELSGEVSISSQKFQKDHDSFWFRCRLMFYWPMWCWSPRLLDGHLLAEVNYIMSPLQLGLSGNDFKQRTFFFLGQAFSCCPDRLMKLHNPDIYWSLPLIENWSLFCNAHCLNSAKPENKFPRSSKTETICFDKIPEGYHGLKKVFSKERVQSLLPHLMIVLWNFFPILFFLVPSCISTRAWSTEGVYLQWLCRRIYSSIPGRRETPLLCFLLPKTHPAEANYDVGNCEWCPWLQWAKEPFTVFTDHKNLADICSAKRLNSRQAR